MKSYIKNFYYIVLSKTVIQYVVVGLLVLLAVGCRQDSREGPGGPAAEERSPLRSEKKIRPAGGEVVKDYPLKGVVRKVAKEAGRVTIRHEAVPGLMGAMTMPFSLKDRAILDRIQSGDSVEGTLRVREERGSRQ